MPTLAVGAVVSVYCPLSGTMTVTPGESGRVSINARGRDGSQSLAPRELYSAATFTVSAGDTVGLEAINAAATYTDPAESGPAIQAMASGAWVQQPVSFDAALSRSCVFAQFADGAYLATDQGNGNFARRLFRLVGDPCGVFTPTTLAATNIALGGGLKDTSATVVGDDNSSILSAWVASNGDSYYMWINGTTQRHYLHRARAGTYTVGSDASYGNGQACIDIGRNAGVHSTGIRAFNPRAFLDCINTAGARVMLFAEYNTNSGRDFNGGVGDQAIVWRSLDGGTTWAVFVELNTTAGQHRIDHWHGVVQDPYTGLIYFLTGDNGAENAVLQWDGVSAAPVANATWAQVAATAGWRVRNGSELLRYTDILFSPTCIYSIPDCDTEGADTTSTGYVSTVIDKSLGWVGTTAPVARQDNVPPAIAVRGRQYSAMVSFIQTAGVRFLDVWAVDGQPENGASWSLVAKIRTYSSGVTATPRSFFIDAAGDLWCGGLVPASTQFSPEVQTGTSVRLRAVPRRPGVDVYSLT